MTVASNPSAVRSTFTRRAATLILTLAAATFAVAAAPATVAAQAQAPVRIAVVNTARVFNELQETKALQARMTEEGKKLEATGKDKANALAKLKQDRDSAIKPGTPQYNDATRHLMQEAAAYKVWGESEKANIDFTYKWQTKLLFDKMQAAIAKVAAQDGIDIVIADTSEKLPDDLDRVDLGLVQAMLIRKSVLFVSARQGLDISAKVMLVMDAEYKTGSGAAAAGGK
jgi:Skp family chaperone for outer membrane proteins